MRKLPAVCIKPAAAARRQHDCFSSTRASSSRKARVKPGPKLSLPLDVAMRDADDVRRLSSQPPGQVFHQDHRPVPPSGAADGQHQPPFLLAHITGGQQVDESYHLVQEQRKTRTPSVTTSSCPGCEQNI